MSLSFTNSRFSGISESRINGLLPVFQMKKVPVDQIVGVLKVGRVLETNTIVTCFASTPILSYVEQTSRERVT